MKPWAESFYKSRTWQQCRELCIKKAGGLCERCGAEGKIKAAVVAHHKTPITKENMNDPSITLSLDNLQALCVECHAAVHHPNQAKRWSVDATGKIAGKE